MCVHVYTRSSACICMGKCVGLCVHVCTHMCMWDLTLMPFCLSLLSCLQDDTEQRGLILLTDTIHPGRQKLSSSAFTALGQVTADRQLCRPYLETFCPTPILSIPFSCVCVTFPLETGLWIYDLMLCTGCWLLWGLRELSEHRHCIPMPSSFPSYRPSGGHSITWWFYLFLRKPPSHCLEWLR